MASPLLSEVRFGSYLVYSPRGQSPVSVKSRRIRDAVKAGAPATLESVVRRLQQEFSTSGLDAVLGSDVTLVPTPRSSPLVEGGLWPGRLLAEALVAVGLGREVVACVSRVEAVPKSSFQKHGERPSARRHYDTMRVEAQLVASKRLTLVDDFLTKGSTLLGAATRLAEAYPQMEVAVFGLVRTKGLQPDVADIVEPCVGRIVRVGESGSDRQP